MTLQQKLVSVNIFLKHVNLGSVLKNRIIEYFTLQNQFRQGVQLPRGVVHLMFDAPTYLRDDALYLDLYEILDGVPVFSVRIS